MTEVFYIEKKVKGKWYVISPFYVKKCNAERALKKHSVQTNLRVSQTGLIIKVGLYKGK
jgi:hypothetical protein